MTPAETATILRQFNKWLRGNKDDPQLESREINQAINAAIEMIERLEAAEKERDALRAELNEIRYWTAVAHDTIKALNARIEAAEKERDWHAERCEDAMNECAALRAKIEEMEKQEPVRHEFQGRDGAWYPFINQRHYKITVADGTWPIRALYALPGAKGDEK